MNVRRLLAATALVAVAGPAFADIQPVVNVSTELANDLRGLTWTADGKIVASGHVGTVNEETRLVVARFNADGTLDTSFSEDGVVDVDVAAGRQESSLGVVVLDNGDVVVAVNAIDEDAGQSVYLLRFDSTGAPVAGWGDDTGKVEVVFGWANADNATWPGVETPPLDTAWDLQVDRTSGTEKLVVFGMGGAAAGTGRTDIDRYVVRLNAADGTVDPTFNGGVPFTYHSTGTFGDQARRGSIEADGKIVAAGYTNLGEGLANHIILFRLNADGTLDETFGNFIYPESTGPAVGLVPTAGVAVFNPFVVDGGFAEGYAAGRLSDGTYVTVGYGGATANGRASTLGYATTAAPDLVAFKVTETGLDTTFGNNGTVAVQSEGRGQPTNEERGRALAVLPDDRIVEVGRYGGNAAAYVLLPNGQLDTTVGDDGIILLPSPTINAQFFAAALSPDGTHIALTTNANAAGARLVVLEVTE
jgi:uncharacterized delta-60 repeat protein